MIYFLKLVFTNKNTQKENPKDEAIYVVPAQQARTQWQWQ
jgi:hypothetical protein